MNSEQRLTHNQKLANFYQLIESGETLSAKNTIHLLLKDNETDQAVKLILTGLDHTLNKNFKDAIADFKLAISHDENNLDAYYYLAKSYRKMKLTKQAISALSQLTSLDKTYAKAWFLLSKIEQKRNISTHTSHLLKAIKNDIDNSIYWNQLRELSLHTKIPLSPELNYLTINAISRQHIDPETISPFIHSFLNSNENLKRLKELNGKNILTGNNIIPLLNDELLLAVMQGTTLYGPDYEILFTRFRTLLLSAISNKSMPSGELDKAISCVSALGIYNLTTEFVFYISSDERQLIEQCKANIRQEDDNDKQTALLYAIIGCYELLNNVAGAATTTKKLERLINNSQFNSMIHYHIHEKEKEGACQKEVIPFSIIEDDTSKEVQRQYEENPYPRWINWGGGNPVTLRKMLTHRLPYLKSNQLEKVQASAEQEIDVLIAGCGTGRNAIIFAKGFFNSQVYAVDLSRASLAYAIMKSKQYSIENITFRHGDLINLPSLNKQFDFIDSSGVLHHMKNPKDGLTAIDKCLKPGGWMRIALYSHIARKTIQKAREEIKKLSIDADPASIREFRKAVIDNPQHPLHGLSTQFRDFYSLSECRDLIFHVQEHQFTTAKLQELIEPFNLKFMGFEQVDPALYKKGSPIKNPQSLEQWGIFEEANPTTFVSMYHMWLHKPL